MDLRHQKKSEKMVNRVEPLLSYPGAGYIEGDVGIT